MTTELVKGKTLKEALSISSANVVEKLGGLPAQKIHCSVLAKEGIKAAVKDYCQKNFQSFCLIVTGSLTVNLTDKHLM